MGDNCYEPIGGGDISAVPMAPPPMMIPTPAPKKSAGEKYVPPPPPPLPSSGPNIKSPTEKSMDDLDEFQQSHKTRKDKSGYDADDKKAKTTTKRSGCAKLFMILTIICFFLNILLAVGFGLLYFGVIKI